MRLAKPVLFAVILSSLPLANAQSGQAGGAGPNGAFEPSERVSGLATLVSTRDSAEGRFAILRFKLVAHAADVAATVHEFDNSRKTITAAPLASMDLKKGESRSVTVRVAVPRNEESHLFYKVKARAIDGTITDLTLYSRIPPDDADPCQAVDEYVQCPGETTAGVEP